MSEISETMMQELNRAAAERFGDPHLVRVVPGATHLFEESGKLDEVSVLACEAT